VKVPKNEHLRNTHGQLTATFILQDSSEDFGLPQQTEGNIN
jgi:hypothetical protein